MHAKTQLFVDCLIASDSLNAMDTDSLLKRAQEVHDEGRAECEKTRGLITEGCQLLAHFERVEWPRSSLRAAERTDRFRGGEITDRGWPTVPQPSLVELTQTVGDIVEELRGEAERRGLRLVFISQVPTGISLKTDSDFLRIILLNLIANANQFTDHSTIVVSISSSDAEYQIGVRD